LIRTAAQSYLLDSGINWGAAPSVKVCRCRAKKKNNPIYAMALYVFQDFFLKQSIGILELDSPSWDVVQTL